MHISSVSEPMFLNFFIWGLKSEIPTEILIHWPLTLVEAMAKAQLFEEGNDDLVSRRRRDGFRVVEGSKNRVGQPGLLTAPRQRTQGSVTTTTLSRGVLSRGETKLSIKRLTPTKIRDYLQLLGRELKAVKHYYYVSRGTIIGANQGIKYR